MVITNEGLLRQYFGKAGLEKQRIYDVLNRLCENKEELKIEFDRNIDSYFPADLTLKGRKNLTAISDSIINEVLDSGLQADLKEWWLVDFDGNPRMPQPDLVSTCKIEGKRGLLLIQVQKRDDSYFSEGKKERESTNMPNHKNIGTRLIETNGRLKSKTNLTFRLSRDSYYQLSNRFAWTWKLAHLGIPVVLVYLGFTNPKNIKNKIKDVYLNHGAFIDSITKGDPAEIVDPSAWDKKFEVVNGDKKTPFIALLRSLECNTFVQ